MQRCLKYVLLMALLVNFVPLAYAGSDTSTVIMQIGSSQAVVDGIASELQISPQIKDDTALVPLRSIVEIFGTQVEWNTVDKEITLRQGETIIRLLTERNEAVIDEIVYPLSGTLVVEDGITLVPLRFLVENLNYQVFFMPSTKEIYIKQLPPPNLPPKAQFEVLNDTVAQGETVIYTENSYDPDGDELVERKWVGKKRAFFAPGDYKVSLQVKDSNGSWSEPFTRVIRVTNEVKKDELTYNLDNPLPGQPLDMSNIPVLEFEKLDPVVILNQEKIMISNSPEIVSQEGILYRDVLSGDNRLYYHHINGTNKAIKIYLLAVNQGAQPVTLEVRRWGTAGPADPLAVGRAAAYRFLNSKLSNTQYLEVQPGEKVVINKEALNDVEPGQTIHGIFGVNASDDLQFTVVAVSSPEQLDKLEGKPLLSHDGKHTRGTFLRANRNVTMRLNIKKPARLVVADGEGDLFLYGKDGEQLTRNKGNYGLIYRIAIRTEFPVGVLFSARGGVFAGAGNWDGQAFNLPNQGLLQPKGGCMIGVVEPGEEKVLEFIPPAGSYLPVNLIFIPF